MTLLAIPMLSRTTNSNKTISLPSSVYAWIPIGGVSTKRRNALYVVLYTKIIFHFGRGNLTSCTTPWYTCRLSLISVLALLMSLQPHPPTRNEIQQHETYPELSACHLYTLQPAALTFHKIDNLHSQAQILIY